MKGCGLAEKGKKLTPECLRLNIPQGASERFHVGLERGQLRVELYIPQKEDFQTPHDRMKATQSLAARTDL